MVSLKFSIILLSLLSLAIITQAQYPTFLYRKCLINYGFYIPNSTYEANLNLILSSLSSNATRNNINGFYNVSAGQAPDVVYGMFLCRGDVSNSVCQSCVSFGTKDVLEKCPMEKVAVMLYDDCELSYSNRNFFSAVDQDFTLFMMMSPNNVTVEPDRFNQLVATTLNNISTRAASATSGAKKFAVQQANYTGDQKLYTLVQCTPYLSTSDCSRCLEGAISELGNCCNRRQGGRVIFRSCNFRYELYEFYNATAEVEAVPAPPPATPSPPPASGSKTSGKGKERTILKTVLGTSIPIVVLVFLTASCIIYFRRIRRKEKDEEKNHRSFFQELRKSRGSTFAEENLHPIENLMLFGRILDKFS
ncbi:CYSTEINE-RICH RECEPTOR-LIKE PROTEIN KINASE 25 [Salix purpurea]|uniref:CYSTEINE-RICH RECEPTOR-LIKE PROTEIN KINASE 25 n=1 Tax=Salix purpurea TaxID=77065 RepID=A0A9Q1AFU1_SALPP|nr:CYSTEINE-RICH RECEPTOR-LIKE PROTEIN KINASE 25 [Salix purpurea]